MAKILENEAVNAAVNDEKPAKLYIIAQCEDQKEGDGWGTFLKDSSGDSHPDFPEGTDVNLKAVVKIVLLTEDLNTENTFFKYQNWGHGHYKIHRGFMICG